MKASRSLRRSTHLTPIRLNRGVGASVDAHQGMSEDAVMVRLDAILRLAFRVRNVDLADLLPIEIMRGSLRTLALEHPVSFNGKLALALEEQMLSSPDELPVSHHDWPVDSLIVGDGRVLVRQR